ncbi:MAG: transposase [Acidobacteriaceae bacterium]
MAWVEQFLCPTLPRGDIVILDNLSSDKVDGVQEAIAAAGTTVFYLPPYSPNLNPIEQFFSKLKTLLRKAARRSTEELWEQIGQLLLAVSPGECANYFVSSGYDST